MHEFSLRPIELKILELKIIRKLYAIKCKIRSNISKIIIF